MDGDLVEGRWGSPSEGGSARVPEVDGDPDRSSPGFGELWERLGFSNRAQGRSVDGDRATDDGRSLAAGGPEDFGARRTEPPEGGMDVDEVAALGATLASLPLLAQLERSTPTARIA
jgi:hypothetical protein